MLKKTQKDPKKKSTHRLIHQLSTGGVHLPVPRNDDAEGARKVLPKALAALERRKHPVVVSKAAILEYQKPRTGEAEVEVDGGNGWWKWSS